MKAKPPTADGIAVRAIIFLWLMAALGFGMSGRAEAQSYNLQTFKPSPSAVLLSSSPDEKCTTANNVLSIPVQIFTHSSVGLSLSRKQVTVPNGTATGRGVAIIRLI